MTAAARRNTPSSKHKASPCSRIEPFALPPLVLVQEHGAEFGQPVRRIIERGQDDRAFRRS